MGLKVVYRIIPLTVNHIVERCDLRELINYCIQKIGCRRCGQESTHGYRYRVVIVASGGGGTDPFGPERHGQHNLAGRGGAHHHVAQQAGLFAKVEE